ncbi:retrovirus-related pol polyprotein from transposon TNT 1-94 [Tanacetum coccineum]|uniref:Retrovirus-related pol polyprotein from transposon TNT 1-94 n=1 Tax=Tanacetum coccineum TaxID=301880 RepID=A0ABQ5G9N5_9ASTR
MVGNFMLNNMRRITGQREVKPVWNNAQRVNHQNKLTHPYPKRNFVPTAVLIKSGNIPVNTGKQSSPRAAVSNSTARYVNTNASRPTLNGAKPSSNVLHKSHSSVKRTFYQRTAPKNSVFKEKVNTAKVNNVTTAGTKAIVSVVQGHEANDVNGCSRHMTGNKFYLSDYQDINGGSVAFGGSSKGGKITGKGKIRTDKLDFEDTECLVLSPDFKLLDESQVLLNIHRQNHMYSFDIKNVVPSGGLIIKCDNGTEFKNSEMNQFCEMKGSKREFSVARTPQQNEVAERKNRTLIEAARTMLADLLLPTTFWAKAINTACYVPNRVLITKPHNKTPYELLVGRSPNLDFMRPFGCLVTILNTLDHLGKFEGKADEGFLVGYSVNSKAFKVFNSRTRKVEENLHVKFLENKSKVVGCGPEWPFDIDSLTKSMNYELVTAGNQTNDDAGIETNINARQAG